MFDSDCFENQVICFPNSGLFRHVRRFGVHSYCCPGLERMSMDYFAHRAPGRRGGKNDPSRRWKKNVTLMNILQRTVERSKNSRGREKHLSKKKKKTKRGVGPCNYQHSSGKVNTILLNYS